MPGQRHQNQHGHAQESGGIEKVSIAVGIDKITREARNEFGQKQHHGTEQSILRGRVFDVGQRGQVGNEGC